MSRNPDSRADCRADFGAVARDYARYRDELPEIVFERLSAFGVRFAESRAADLGCGCGAMTRELRVRGTEVIGVEPSARMLREARRLDRLRGVAVRYVRRAAEDTGLQGRAFDLVAAVRAWHWFERSKAIAETVRLLVPGGLLIVIDAAFVPDRSGLAKDTLEIIRRHVPGGVLRPAGSKAAATVRLCGFPVEWFAEWAAAGLRPVHIGEEPYDVSYTAEEWRGRVRSLSWVSVLSREKLDAELAEHLSRHFSAPSFRVPHRCSIATLRLDGEPPP